MTYEKILLALRICFLASLGITFVYAPAIIADNRFFAMILAAILLALCVSDVLCQYFYRKKREQFAFFAMLIDMVSVGVGLYLTGGSTNPFISCLLIYNAIAAAQFRRSLAWGFLALSILIYSGLLWIFLNPNDPHFLHLQGAHFIQHVIGMAVNFVLCGALLVVLIGYFAEQTRQHERALQFERENAARDQYIFSLATLAAGTAHELGTPLNTLELLCDECLALPENTLVGNCREDFELMREQIELCKDRLQQLRQHNLQNYAQKNHVHLLEWLNQTADIWQVMRPNGVLQRAFTALDKKGDIRIPFGSEIQQAILNFLHNAAHASAQNQQSEWALWRVLAREKSLIFQIEDMGKGIPHAIRLELGQNPQASETGLGVGVLLSGAAITRAGGSLAFLPRAGGGTQVEIELSI